MKERLVLMAHGSRDPRWREPFEMLMPFKVCAIPSQHLLECFSCVCQIIA